MFGCLMFVWSVWRWECMGMCDGGMSVQYVRGCIRLCKFGCMCLKSWSEILLDYSQPCSFLVDFLPRAGTRLAKEAHQSSCLCASQHSGCKSIHPGPAVYVGAGDPSQTLTLDSQRFYTQRFYTRFYSSQNRELLSLFINSTFISCGVVFKTTYILYKVPTRGTFLCSQTFVISFQ